MKEKFFSAIMAGIYIALGTITYLSIPNPIVGTLFFSTGIFLVFNFNNMLVTRLIPLGIATKEYTVIDVVIAFFGNGIGAFLVAVIIHFTRFEANILERLQTIGKIKLSDTPVSLFLMGFLCALFVSYAVLISKKYKNGSFAQIFYIWLLISAFVFGGYDHIVANFYYLSAYTLAFGLEAASVLKVIFFVTIGNIAGGVLVGMVEKRFILVDKTPASLGRE